MKPGRKCIIGLLILTLICLTGASFIGSADALSVDDLLKRFGSSEPEKPLLDPGITVRDWFQKGPGAAIGSVQTIQGNVYVIHKEGATAYRLKKDTPIFNGDTVITAKRARMYAILNDKSVIALGELSKFVFSESTYVKKSDSRYSFFKVLFGQVRFIVNKISGKSTYQIRTDTAVCGVRGTDFAISVSPDREKTSALMRFLAYISPVREAHAQIGGLMTSVITGPASSVTFSGLTGPPVIVGPAAFSSAKIGGAAIKPFTVGWKGAVRVLNRIAPRLARLNMPQGYE